MNEYEPIDVSGKYAGSVPEVFVCLGCGALVTNVVTHDKFHTGLSYVADEARWAGFGGRPL